MLQSVFGAETSMDYTPNNTTNSVDRLLMRKQISGEPPMMEDLIQPPEERDEGIEEIKQNKAQDLCQDTRVKRLSRKSQTVAMLLRFSTVKKGPLGSSDPAFLCTRDAFIFYQMCTSSGTMVFQCQLVIATAYLLLNYSVELQD